ncbi:hypothetical protein KSS87_020983 [Heliosperma pusillum]|nr:hypothetical protein KSS87_020983 [Heliosperma pusillum]
MSGREVREYTNLSDPKDKKYGKGKDKIDDEDITFQRMVAKVLDIRTIMNCLLCCLDLGISVISGILAFLFGWLIKQMQEVAGERGGYLHGRGALDSDDLLYLKEQMEAEQDAERLLRRTEKRAFAAFKISFLGAANLADSSPAPAPLPLRVEPKPKSGIRQQDLLKKVVEIKPKRPKLSIPSDTTETALSNHKVEEAKHKEKGSELSSNVQDSTKAHDATKSLLGLAYESSDSED